MLTLFKQMPMCLQNSVREITMLISTLWEPDRDNDHQQVIILVSNSGRVHVYATRGCRGCRRDTIFCPMPTSIFYAPELSQNAE